MSFFTIVFVLIIAIGDFNVFRDRPELPDPFADGVADATSEISLPENAIRVPVKSL